MPVRVAHASVRRAQPRLPTAAGSPPSRVLGVLPNYRSGEDSDPFTPLSVRRKFYIGYKDSTDYPIFFVAGALAALGQMTDQHPEFGQGMEGYGKRLGGSIADQLIGNFLTESVMPSLLREDPRYFRRGRGSLVAHRIRREPGLRGEKRPWQVDVQPRRSERECHRCRYRERRTIQESGA